jgi:hypothetical protein
MNVSLGNLLPSVFVHDCKRVVKSWRHMSGCFYIGLMSQYIRRKVIRHGRKMFPQQRTVLRPGILVLQHVRVM